MTTKIKRSGNKAYRQLRGEMLLSGGSWAGYHKAVHHSILTDMCECKWVADDARLRQSGTE